MGKIFEDEFMDWQSDLISLCLEVLEGQEVDKIYAYCSIEKKMHSFNAFFEINGEIKTLNLLVEDRDLGFEFLSTGTDDLQKLIEICEKYKKPTPTEMKLCYDTKTGKFDASYKYDPVFTRRSKLSPGIVFHNWIDEMKKQRS